MKDDFFRFQIFVTRNLKEGHGSRSVVGAAYLRAGQRLYTLKLWMFPSFKFYLMADNQDKSRMLIFTREPKKDQSIGKGKYFWNLIGDGVVDAANEVVKLQFSLFDKPIYMSIFPATANEMNSEAVGEIMDAS